MFLLNRLTFLILAASMYGQLPTSLRYSLKSFDLDSTYNKGIRATKIKIVTPLIGHEIPKRIPQRIDR